MKTLFNIHIKGIAFVFLYKLAIEIMYFSAVCPIYGYRGYFVEINILKYILSWIFAIAIFMLLPKGNKISHRILQMHYVTMILPFISIFACSNQDLTFCSMILSAFALQLVILRLVKTDIKIPRLYFKPSIILLFITIMTVYVYVNAIKFYGVHFKAINFANIADIRINAGQITGLVGYLILWQYRMINPYLMIYSLKKKNYGILVVSIFLQLLMFFIVARKEVLFSIFLILGLYWWIEKFNLLHSMLVCLGIASVISAIIAFNFRLPLSIMIRILIDPAMIKFRHFQIFSTILPKLQFSEGKIGKILNISYPYDKPSGYIVSELHNNVISNENTGYLAYAYDNGGFIAMIFMSIIFICLLLLLDAIACKKNKNLMFAFVAYPMYTLNDGDLLTCLLSGGFIIALFILWIDCCSFERKEKNENSTRLYVRSLRRRVGISQKCYVKTE